MSAADTAEVTFEGDWRLEVVERDAAWDQRFVVSGSTNADGPHAGVVGNSVDVRGDGRQPWTVRMQHDDGSGWDDSIVRETSLTRKGSQLSFELEVEDSTDRDFNDLIVRAEKVGMIDVTTRPYAVRPDTLQMTPDGIFETAFGRYYMGVQVRNVWTEPLPADSRLSITPRSETTLSAGGVEVLDDWRANELEKLNQEVTDGAIHLGALDPWETRTVYFEVDVSEAQPRKHDVEFRLVEPAMPDPDHPNRRTTRNIFVSRTTYDSGTGEFTFDCDQGQLVADIQEVAVEYRSLKRVVECAREYREDHEFEARARELLSAIAEGDEVDICELRRVLDCACADRDRGDGRDRDGWPCEDVVAIPTAVDYRVEPDPAYTGQHGPLPYSDPWWKVALAVLALIFTAAAGGSAAADIANRNDDTIIGTLHESSQEVDPSKGAYLVDAALCELDGSRDLPPVTPPIELEDAESGERFTEPVESLDSAISLSGDTMSNSEIRSKIAAVPSGASSPSDVQPARVFKSGARSGTTHGFMSAIGPLERESNGEPVRRFVEQIRIDPLPGSADVSGQAVSQGGDSGSLWIHADTGKIVGLNHAGPTDDSGDYGYASRIRDVMNELNIDF